MRISDWSSDVCSSDLPFDQPGQAGVDSIDVESCDLQIRMPPIGRRGRLFARPQIEKDEPQPQPEAALGLRTWKAAPPSDSEKSTSEPSRRSRLVGSITKSAEHTSELQSLMRISYAGFRLK